MEPSIQIGQPRLAAMSHVCELHKDGRLTVTEIAGRVGLSLFAPPPLPANLVLEQSGAISGYYAHLDANALGLTFETL
jgi:DNA-binding Lrp family transcriptional regulator